MNHRISLRLVIIFQILLFNSFGYSKVRLPNIIGNNMIIQQQADVQLWGWDKPEKEVQVMVSWDKEIYKTVTNQKGKWSVRVRTPEASYTPLSISFNDGETVTIHNVLAGEVWVCTGQSNMEIPLRGFNNCPIEGYNDAIIQAANQKSIHYVKIPSRMSMKPLDDAQCQWKIINQQTVSECSAIGYYFASLLQKSLNIPIGLVMANKGGTRVESWLDQGNLTKYTQEPLDSMKIVSQYPKDYLRPLLWGNGTFYPILNYTVKGILFYQGCSNVGAPDNQYSERLKLLVEQWRRDFNQGQLPFYFVQIAPYFQNNDGDNGIVGALLREQQLKASQMIPNSELVCTNDCVYPWERTQIHPCQKKPVGERLAYIALNHLYGFQHIWAESPSYQEMTTRNDTCFVVLKNLYGGISRLEDIKGFEMAGDDKIFHPANASFSWIVINGKRTASVAVTSTLVEHPVAVRYCFRNFQLGNLKNNAGLPLFPFRTDNW